MTTKCNERFSSCPKWQSTSVENRSGMGLLLTQTTVQQFTNFDLGTVCHSGLLYPVHQHDKYRGAEIVGDG
ncbi:hypothetical protein J6590_047240 [Homalodisca vitripennis]|nr:hypothetical protein J6590_047240 [Homalodisca vitripennis]